MLYVFDLDGVIYRMDEPVPGAADTIRRLRNRGDKVYYLTNNSSRTRDDYVTKLASFGIPAAREEIMTSAYALGQWFNARETAGKTAYIIGESGLHEELTAVGLTVITQTGPTDLTAPTDSAQSKIQNPKSKIDFVVVGWDRSATYAKLADAHRAIVESGAVFIATNRDATYPDAGGKTLPGSGALVAALATCTGIEPIVIGKPEPFTLELILQSAGAAPRDCVVVGDRLDTDILIGKRVGAQTILVLTGVHSEADLPTYPPTHHPTQILPSLSHLP